MKYLPGEVAIFTTIRRATIPIIAPHPLIIIIVLFQVTCSEGTGFACQHGDAKNKEYTAMKKYLFLIWIILFTSSIALAAIQQTTEKPAPPQTQMQSGVVTSVDAEKNLLVIKNAADEEITLLVSGDTKITRDGEAATLADIKAGDKITSECQDSEGICKAMSITATGANP